MVGGKDNEVKEKDVWEQKSMKLALFVYLSTMYDYNTLPRDKGHI